MAGERAGEGRFKLDLPPEQPVPIVIAALRERMLQTAGELGDGAFLNFLPLASMDTVLEELRKGEREAGKEEGSTETFCRFFCIQGDPEQTLGLARWMFCAYATVPVYEQYFRWLGYGDDIDPMIDAWRGGDRGKALELAPQRSDRGHLRAGRRHRPARTAGGLPGRRRERARAAARPRGEPGAALGADAYGALVEELAPDGGGCLVAMSTPIRGEIWPSRRSSKL